MRVLHLVDGHTDDVRAFLRQAARQQVWPIAQLGRRRQHAFTRAVRDRRAGRKGARYRPFRDAGLFGDIAGSGFVVFYHGCVDPCFGEVKLYPARSDPLSARRHVCCNYVPFLHPIAICCATGCKR